MEGILIAVVDDDSSIRTATARLLRSCGFQVHVFAAAEEFLHSSCLLTTSCLVVDVQMPGMNGLELQSYLANTGHRIPVIFVSGSLDEGKRAKAINAGAAAYLHKPVGDEALVNGILTALNPQTDNIGVTRQYPSPNAGTHFFGPITNFPDIHISGTLRELRDYAANENDFNKLRQLLIEINALLNILETRLPELGAWRE